MAKPLYQEGIEPLLAIQMPTPTTMTTKIQKITTPPPLPLFVSLELVSFLFPKFRSTSV